MTGPKPLADMMVDAMALGLGSREPLKKYNRPSPCRSHPWKVRVGRQAEASKKTGKR